MKRWRFVLLGILGALVVALASVWMVGSRLPQNHVATRSARYRQPPETVFRTITDFGNAPTWRTDLTRVEMLHPAAGLPRFREHGSDDAMTMEVVEMRAPRHLVVRIADSDLPFGGRWVYNVEPASDGTRLTITEEGEVYNPIFRFVARFLIGHHATIEEYLRALGDKFGEEAVVF
jgi:uncharacterized protein YndB with AHSA1/START domain